MKKVLICMGMAVISSISYAQSNNPYNQRGIDFKNSISLIEADYNAGKVKDFNEESVAKYSKSIPLQNKMTMDLATTIIEPLKAPGYRFETEIAKSTVSDYAKTAIFGLFGSKGASDEDYRALFTKKTDDINKAKISAQEKELLLSIVAMVYNYQPATATSKAQCFVQGPEGSGTMPCGLAGAIVGAVIGFEICGVWCALGGAVVGAVLGSLC